MHFPELLCVEVAALLELLDEAWPLSVRALERVNARLQARSEGFETLLKAFRLVAL